jgi:hypothetical protein
MDTPSFEQTLEYERFLTSNFDKFKDYLFKSNMVAIQEWLNSYVSHTPIYQHSFVRMLENHRQSLTRNSAGDDLQMKQARLAILQHLDGMVQLRLNQLIFMIDETFDNDYLKIMKMPDNDNDKATFFNDYLWCRYTTFQLHYENFSVIDEIESFFNHDFLRKEHKHFYLFFPQKKNPTEEDSISWQMTSKVYPLSPYHDILFNYSLAKEEYLYGKGIELPSFEQILTIEKAMLERGYTYAHDEATVTEALACMEDCKTIAHYRKMESIMEKKYASIQDTDTLIKAPKI